jgi:MFS family permease
MTSAGSKTDPGNQSRAGLAGFVEKFLVLKGAIRELWLVFAIKLLVFAAYGLNNLTMALWLSWNLGFSDTKAGGLVALWSLSMTVFTLLVGSLTDAVGLRRTFFLGVGFCIFARAMMTFTTVPWLALACGVFPLAIGEALTGPVLISSVQRFSNTKQRSISFSLIYTISNVGFIVAGKIFDYVRDPRHGLGEHGQIDLPVLGRLGTYQVCLLATLIIEVLILPFVYFLRRGAEATDGGLKIVPAPPKYEKEGLWNSFRFTVRDSFDDTIRIFGNLLRQAGFHRLLIFLLFISFLKLIFMQMYYVYPKFGIRVLGEGAPVGQLWNINGYVVILLVPLIGVLTQRFSAYAMVVVGGVISAASVFVMALPTAWFQSLAGSGPGQWFGHWYLNLNGSVHPYYVMIALFVILLSIGEAFYSPRVYEYAAAIAPKGQESSYGALSYVPFLLAKILVGTLSTALLVHYCPEHGERHPGMMWLILGMVASICPIGLLVLRRQIRIHEAGREE